MIVISAIRFRQGGPLRLYKNILRELDNSSIAKNKKIIAFVGNKSLFEIYDNVELYEVPKIYNNYLGRIIFGTIFTFLWSLNKNISTWIDLHDFPSLHISKKSWVYVHNPSIYLNLKISYLRWDFKQFMLILTYPVFTFFLSPLFHGLIVQQNWLSGYFRNKIVFVHNAINPTRKNYKKSNTNNKKLTYIYPSIPRIFKGHETIIKSLKYLQKEELDSIRIIFTIDGTENKWSKYIAEKSKNLPIDLIGYQSNDNIDKLYAKVDFLIFPSLAETWGLPLSEAREFKLPIIVKQAEYINGPLSGYDKVKVFSDAKALSIIISQCINGDLKYQKIPDNYTGNSFKKLFE